MDGIAIQFFPQRLVNELLTLNQPLALEGIGIHLNGDVTSIGVIIRAGNFYIVGSQRRRDLLRANIDDGLALPGLGRHRPGEYAKSGTASWDGGECPCRSGEHGNNNEN